MDREKAIDEAKFTSGELREALVERHSEETPVSYTHLDVYKRQVLCCSFLQDAAAFEPEALRCGTARNVLMRMCAPAASLQKKESGKPGHNAR